MSDDIETVGVLDRIVAVLDAFDRDDRGLRIGELSDRAGLPTSTVSRVVAGLVRAHYLERDGAHVRLGLRLFELGQLAVDPRRLRAAAGPVLAQLRRETGGSVHLAVRDGDDAVVLLLLRGRPLPFPLAPVGDRSSLGATALGRAMRDAAPAGCIARTDSPVSAVPVLAGPAQPSLAVSLSGVRDDDALRTSALILAERVTHR